MNLSKSLHPRIYEALDRLQAQMLYGASAEEATSDAELPDRAAQKPVQEVMGRHAQIWWQTYGAEFSLKGLAVVLVNLATMTLAGQLNTPVALTLPIATLTVSSVATFRWLKRNERTVAPTELKNLLPALELTLVERAYCDAILEVTAHPSLDRAGAQDIATQLNDLLTNSVEMDAQKALILRAMGSIRSTAELETERDQILRRLHTTDDPVARDALAQSVELCEGRLQNRRSLDPLLHRLDAQQEMIRQSLMNVGESLARLRVSPHAVHSPDVEAIKRSVVDINRQTSAVEQAVQEVLLLRSSG